MCIYYDENMVNAKDIIEIDMQLKKFGSKVPENYLDGKEHVLVNILHLACGGSSFVISLKDINSIGNNGFSIESKCEPSITRQN